MEAWVSEGINPHFQLQLVGYSSCFENGDRPQAEKWTRPLMQTLAIGADHGGFELKHQLAEHIRSRGFAVEDCGTHSTEAFDYPKIAAEVARRVADGRTGVGVIIDGAGIGSSMTANKCPGVRAALCD